MKLTKQFIACKKLSSLNLQLEKKYNKKTKGVISRSKLKNYAKKQLRC